MKRVRFFKFFSVSCGAILLLLVATAAASAVDGALGEISAGSNASTVSAIWQQTLQQLFEGWHGSKTLSFLAAVFLVLAITGRGIGTR